MACEPLKPSAEYSDTFVNPWECHSSKLKEVQSKVIVPLASFHENFSAKGAVQMQNVCRIIVLLLRYLGMAMIMEQSQGMFSMTTKYVLHIYH